MVRRWLLSRNGKSILLAGIQDFLRWVLDEPAPSPPPIIQTQWGPVSERARQRAALNMRDDHVLREAVETLVIQEVGDVARGLAECRRRYPESYTDDEK